MDSSAFPMQNHRNPRQGIILVLTAGVLWGLLGVIVRQLLSAGITVEDVVAMRSVGTALLLGVSVGCIAPSQLKVQPKHLWCMAGCGIVSVVCFNCCYFSLLRRTSLGVAAILLYTSPIFVTIFARFCFREAITPRKWLALLLMSGGCLLVSGVIGDAGGATSARLSWPVMLLGLGSGMCYGLYSIFGGYAQRFGYSSLAITAWAFAIAAIFLAPFADWGNILQCIGRQPTLILWWAAMTVGGTILPYWCYTAGLARMEASAAAVVVSIEPVTAAIAGVLLYKGECPNAITLCGMALVLLAVYTLRPVKEQGS